MSTQFLVLLAVILACGWLAARIARRIGMSAAVGQMIMGLALGPSLLGIAAAESAEPLGWMARAAVMLLMFHVGLEFEVSHFAHARNQRTVAAVSIAALVVPFLVGLAFGRATAPILQELDLQRTEVGVIAIGAAAFNDAVGWILLAIVSAFSSSPLGIAAVLGCFAFGVLLHRRERLVTAWNRRAGPVIGWLLLPVYFTYTGLRTDAGSLDGAEAWMWCVAVLLVATASKFGATYLAARWSGLERNRAAALGAMMNTRGLVELVVLNIGYDLGLISKPMFTMLVLMAVLSTAVTTPLLRRWVGSNATAPCDRAATASAAAPPR